MMVPSEGKDEKIGEVDVLFSGLCSHYCVLPIRMRIPYWYSTKVTQTTPILDPSAIPDDVTGWMAEFVFVDDESSCLTLRSILEPKLPKNRSSMVEYTVTPYVIRQAVPPVVEDKLGFEDVFAALEAMIPTITREQVRKFGCASFDSKDSEYNTHLVDVSRHPDIIRHARRFCLKISLSWFDYNLKKDELKEAIEFARSVLPPTIGLGDESGVSSPSFD